MPCPQCHSSNTDMTHKQTDGQGYSECEDYVCNDCECEWEWAMEMTILKQGIQEEE